jgi:hypothetical protein
MRRLVSLCDADNRTTKPQRFMDAIYAAMRDKHVALAQNIQLRCKADDVWGGCVGVYG